MICSAIGQMSFGTFLPSDAIVLMQPERTICRSLRLVQACLLVGFSVQAVWPYLSGSVGIIALIYPCPGCLGIPANSRLFELTFIPNSK